MNSTKIWLTKSGGCIVANNNSRIPEKELNRILEIITVYYFNNGEIRACMVTGTHVAETNEIWTVELENGEKIRNTAKHPYYIIGKDWVLTENLQIGDKVLTQENDELTIIDLRKDMEHTKVYNITVEDYHNYFVGNNKILVHNK